MKITENFRHDLELLPHFYFVNKNAGFHLKYDIQDQDQYQILVCQGKISTP